MPAPSWSRRSVLTALSGCILISLLFFTYLFVDLRDLQDRWSLRPVRPVETTLTTGDLPRSRRLGSVPGYMVFDNLWYHDKVFYYNGPQTDIPTDVDDIMHAPVSLRYTNTTPSTSMHRMTGSTVFLNDHPDVNPMLLAWFYHFASEEILGALAALSTASESIPDRVIIPWVENWRDGYGLNEVFATGVWRNVIIESREWNDIENWIFFERIVIVDRQAAGRAPLSSEWNKMALNVLSAPHPPHFFEPVRNKFLSSLSIPVRTRENFTGPARLVYVDRQSTSRRLSDKSQEGLLQILAQLEQEGILVWTHGKFNEMAIDEQVKATAAADIILGVHGNGLTHQLWMSPGGSIVEIFPAGTFTRDYQVVAETIRHNHYYYRYDQILPREQWETMVLEQNPAPLYDGTQIEIEATFLKSFLLSLVAEYNK